MSGRRAFSTSEVELILAGEGAGAGPVLTLFMWEDPEEIRYVQVTEFNNNKDNEKGYPYLNGIVRGWETKSEPDPKRGWVKNTEVSFAAEVWQVTMW